jgi:hypothetical protein
MLQIIDKWINQISVPVYYSTMIFVYFIYIGAIMGISYSERLAKYAHYITSFVQIFIAVILMIRFNPFRKTTLHDNDIPLIFGCAFFLLFNVFIVEWLQVYKKLTI